MTCLWSVCLSLTCLFLYWPVCGLSVGEVYPARPVERGSVPQLPGGDHDVVRSLPVLDLCSPGVGTCQCHFAPLPDLPIDQGQWNPPAGKVRTQTLRRRSSIPWTYPENSETNSIYLVDSEDAWYIYKWWFNKYMYSVVMINPENAKTHSIHLEDSEWIPYNSWLFIKYSVVMINSENTETHFIFWLNGEC